MDAPMAGIVTIVFALLLSRRLGWNSDPARLPILIATVLFSAALFLPTVAVTEQESAWLIAGHLATALGALVLVIGMFQLERTGGRKSDKPKKPKRRRETGGKTATRPLPMPNEEAQAIQDLDDPYAGPHGNKA